MGKERRTPWNEEDSIESAVSSGDFETHVIGSGFHRIIIDVLLSATVALVEAPSIDIEADELCDVGQIPVVCKVFTGVDDGIEFAPEPIGLVDIASCVRALVDGSGRIVPILATGLFVVVSRVVCAPQQVFALNVAEDSTAEFRGSVRSLVNDRVKQ